MSKLTPLTDASLARMLHPAVAAWCLDNKFCSPAAEKDAAADMADADNEVAQLYKSAAAPRCGWHAERKHGHVKAALWVGGKLSQPPRRLPCRILQKQLTCD